MIKTDFQDGELRLTVHDRADSDDAKSIHKNLVEYNVGAYGRSDWRDLTVAFKTKRGELMGGLHGQTGWQWLFVKHLWVSEKARGQGLGTKLMQEAEREAVRRGCRGVWLDTFSFQARGFYEKLGFSLYGTIEDFPPGHQRFFLKKHF